VEDATKRFVKGDVYDQVMAAANTQLSVLMVELKKAMPTVQFGVVPDAPMHWNVAVYRKGHLYCMGEIGYGKFLANSEKEVYIVRSPRILNMRYAANNVMRNANVSQNIDHALGIASAKFIPLSVEDEVEVTKAVPRKKLSETLASKQTRLNDLGVVHYNDVLAEFENLRAQGVTFKTEAFINLASKFDELTDDYNREMIRHTNMYYVWIMEQHGVQHAVVVTVDNVRNKGTISVDGPKHVFKLSDLPMEIAAKIATLSMSDYRSYVEGLGVRLDDTHFWIERDDQGRT
jgi:hypothetical protein